LREIDDSEGDAFVLFGAGDHIDSGPQRMIGGDDVQLRIERPGPWQR
jgi:hypothetical protein